MIESGSTRKYLLYAIGEILLVMIGILLAFQVNNCKERRRVQEKISKNNSIFIHNDILQLFHCSWSELFNWNDVNMHFLIKLPVDVPFRVPDLAFRSLFT